MYDRETILQCAKICQEQRSSKVNIVAPLTNAAYDEACRDCSSSILDLLYDKEASSKQS